MTGPVAVETSTGAQLLPPTEYGRLTARDLTGYHAHLACDADHRAKHPAYREIAARITITKEKNHAETD